ncbi:hypothetical protein [Bacillus taeanensis]|uniref:Uncharacterized protein n=1 Tax=Bacillus taeanensis TaxID=273032 RepID=A0A366XZ96_9BACI|nr:hypothetical protein [Bacillus taeanensis]RBW69473.1 hypothetical protein DS031_11150 [Bacillus taeanensis]
MNLPEKDTELINILEEIMDKVYFGESDVPRENLHYAVDLLARSIKIAIEDKNIQNGRYDYITSKVNAAYKWIIDEEE